MFCEVTSWLDWWLSSCRCFRGVSPRQCAWHFMRLMLSGPRALDFLGDQVLRLSVIWCVLAEIPSYLLFGLRSRYWGRQLWYYHSLVFGLFPFSFARLCSEHTVRLRPALLFTGRCIHRRFPRFLQLVPPRLSPRLLPLLTMVALSHVASVAVPNADSPLLFLYPSGSEAGGPQRSDALFGGLRWQLPGCRIKVLLAGICLCCRWVLPVCTFEH